MKENFGRRTFLRTGTAMTATVLGFGAGTAAAASTKVTIKNDEGNEVSYTIEFNDGTSYSGSNLNFGDTDTYYVDASAEIDRLVCEGGYASGDYSTDGTLVVTQEYNLETSQTGTVYINGIESGGSDDLIYGMNTNGDFDGNGNEIDDGVTNDGERAYGSVNAGGSDSFDMSGQFTTIEMSPRGGKFEIDRYI
jgi:hypothetical protein